VSEPHRRWRVALVLLVAAVLAAYVWGGYGEGWGWTGLSGDVALWDWLEALALPVTVGLVPVLLQRGRRLSPRVRALVLGLLAAFAVLVLAGYLVPWAWTGFTGNTLWDWLELALLPVVLGTAAIWPAPERLRPTHWGLIGAAAVVSMVVVLAGYLVPWSWTGFTDNTAWDWLKLLALLVLPALSDYLDRTVPAAPVRDGAGPGRA
jgi:hypothetical protein